MSESCSREYALLESVGCRLCTALTLLHIPKLLSSVDIRIYLPAVWDFQFPYIIPKICDIF